MSLRRNDVAQLPDAEGVLPDDLVTISREGRWLKIRADDLSIWLTSQILPVYADNTAAAGAGLAVGRAYRTATGQVMVRY